MTMDVQFDTDLERLCTLAGIVASYRDFYGNEHVASRSTKQHLLQAMGLNCDSEERIKQHIDYLECTPWRRLVPPVLVQQEGSLTGIPLSIPAHDAGATLAWKLRREDGITHEGHWLVHEHESIDGREIDGVWRERRMIHFTERLPLGYHRLQVQYAGHDHTITEMRWIITPERCYVPPAFEKDQRIFGVGAQLYSLRDKDDWGIGNFGTLRKLAQGLNGTGVSLIGVNPLHELSPSYPEASSPYSPSSRLTLNPIYLDVTAIPDFAESEEARALYYHPELVIRRAQARDRDIIDYAPIVAAKRRILDACYASFRDKHLGRKSDRAQRYTDFLDRSGETLTRLCTFNAISEKFVAEGIRSWHEWPEPYRNVHSDEVRRFYEEHREEIEYFAYVQWETQRQLAAAHDACAEMPVGIYCDLAVGVDSQSADTWAQPQLFAKNVGVGAPPDPLSPEGQGWGLVPFSPLALYENGYAEFSNLLRANMQHAGALRIDHAMVLLRLYWIPDGLPASEGAYVLYNVNDLFNIVALESHRAKCLVIGEDLGTLPEGFRDRLAYANLLSYRLLRFERVDGGGFVPAEHYPPLALASVGTHDLPPLAGFWHGNDILVREDMGWVHDRDGEYGERARERERLVRLLVETGDLASEEAEKLQGDPHDDQDLGPLINAAYRFIARTPSLIALVQIEDLIGLRASINIPGTTHQHPNWRRRIPITVEELVHDPRTHTLLDTMRLTRGVPTA